MKRDEEKKVVCLREVQERIVCGVVDPEKEAPKVTASPEAAVAGISPLVLLLIVVFLASQCG